jgi:hypothetical protein
MSKKNSELIYQFLEVAAKSKLQIASIFITSILICGLILFQQNSNPKYKGSVLIVGKMLEDDFLKKIIKNINSNIEEKNLLKTEQQDIAESFDYFRSVGLVKVDSKPIVIKDKNVNGFELNMYFATASIQDVKLDEVYGLLELIVKNRIVESELYKIQRKYLEISISDLEEIIKKSLKRQNSISELVDNQKNNSVIILDDSYSNLSGVLDLKNKLLLDLSYTEPENLVMQLSDLTLENDNTRKILLLINTVFIALFLSLSLVGLKLFIQK